MATSDVSAEGQLYLEGWLYICHSTFLGEKKEARWIVVHPDRRMLKIYKDPKKKDKKATSVHLLGTQVDIDSNDPLKIIIQSDEIKTKIKANTPEECSRWVKVLQYCTYLQPQSIVKEETTDDSTVLYRRSSQGPPEPPRENATSAYQRSIVEKEIVGSEMQQGHDDIQVLSSTSADPSYFCVGTIDFGTTFSTWAFSFKSDFKADPTEGVTVKNWETGGDSALISEKCPTALLIAPDATTVVAFGYKAESAYAELAKDNKHEPYFYFRRFKMVLNKKLGEGLDRGLKIEDINDRSLRAIDVVSMTIKYLKDDMKSQMDKQLKSIVTDKDIKWVLTVPAIWTDGAKQFMREAGIQAGIDSERLSLALEPEAASILCRHIPMDGIGIAGLEVGARYLVLDAGGGTIDVTIHEVEDAGRLKEVHAACGGPWGGMYVDRAFMELLKDMFGENVVQTFRDNHMDDWIYFWRSFETKKRDVSQLYTVKEVTLRLPLSLRETYENILQLELSTGISNGPFRSKIRVDRDKLYMKPDLFKGLYNESITNTLDLLTQLKAEKHFDTILMVGGYSQSTLLQEAVKQKFSDRNVIIPRGCSTAIVKGALIWGHMPHIISQRVLKYTYGTRCSITIDKKDKNHQNCTRDLIEGEMVCLKTFSKHVELGKEVKYGEKSTKSYRPLKRNQQEIYFPLYASNNPNPLHVFDTGCICLGNLTIRLREPAKDPKAVRILIHFTFSDTELVVDGEEEGSDKKVSVTLNCLC